MTNPRTLKQREYRRRTAYRGTQSVDNEMVKVHVARLQRAGWTRVEIAKAAGLYRETLNRAMHGDKRIYRSTHDAIMGVKGEPAAPQTLVDATGTVRRLQALAAEGWSWVEIDKHRGVDNGCYGCRTLTQRSVTKAFADDIAAVYDKLAGTKPPAVTTCQKRAITFQRNRARAAGWAPSLAWDCIDNPLEKPKGVRHAA
jgi:lambda repressor-like predicted transcriptional regulator